MAVEEMFTSLPTVATAQMTDIICAVQGYSSPSVLGLSVQETLSQVYSLFQSNLILYNAGNPNGAVAGTTFQLCWDTTDNLLWVCTTSGAPSSAVWTKSIQLTAGNNISIVQNGSNITINAAGPSGIVWTTVSGTTNMASNNGYIANSGSLVTLNLPATSVVGDQINIIGKGTGGWLVQCGAGQTIVLGTQSTSSGGTLASTSAKDSFFMTCTVASLEWTLGAAPLSLGLTYA
jgi:hypothetical protein